MKKEYNFKKGKRGAVLSSKGKTRITLYLDNDVLEKFRERADSAGMGYQTMINRTLRNFLDENNQPLDEATLRKTIREELENDRRQVTFSLEANRDDKEIVDTQQQTCLRNLRVVDSLFQDESTGTSHVLEIKSVVTDRLERIGQLSEEFPEIVHRILESPSDNLTVLGAASKFCEFYTCVESLLLEVIKGNQRDYRFIEEWYSSWLDEKNEPIAKGVYGPLGGVYCEVLSDLVKEKDSRLPSGPSWHQMLLDKALEYDIISDELKEVLDSLRKFRHAARYVHGKNIEAFSYRLIKNIKRTSETLGLLTRDLGMLDNLETK